MEAVPADVGPSEDNVEAVPAGGAGRACGETAYMLSLTYLRSHASNRATSMTLSMTRIVIPLTGAIFPGWGADWLFCGVTRACVCVQ